MIKKIMVTSSKVNFMYPSVTETSAENSTLIMYMFWCFCNVLLFSWLVFVCYFYAVDRLNAQTRRSIM